MYSMGSSSSFTSLTHSLQIVAHGLLGRSNMCWYQSEHHPHASQVKGPVRNHVIDLS